MVGFSYWTARHCYIIVKIYVVDLMVSEKKSHYKSLGAIIHWGVASLDPRGLVGRKYVGNHLTVIYTKYISCGLHGFRVKNF